MKITNRNVGDDQSKFMKRGMCGPGLCTRNDNWNNLKKNRKLYVAFHGPEKAYDKVDKVSLWDVLRMYEMGGCLLGEIRTS